MIVDDHAIVRKMVCSLFEGHGFKVCSAENGAEAIRIAQELQPRLIILDFAMPVMNGLEAARALKQLMPKVPLLMFTQNEGSIMGQEARSAGISAVVSKSGSAVELLRHASGLLN